MRRRERKHRMIRIESSFVECSTQGLPDLLLLSRRYERFFFNNSNFSIVSSCDIVVVVVGERKDEVWEKILRKKGKLTRRDVKTWKQHAEENYVCWKYIFRFQSNWTFIWNEFDGSHVTVFYIYLFLEQNMPLAAQTEMGFTRKINFTLFRRKNAAISTLITTDKSYKNALKNNKQ